MEEYRNIMENAFCHADQIGAYGAIALMAVSPIIAMGIGAIREYKAKNQVEEPRGIQLSRLIKSTKEKRYKLPNER